MEKQNTTPENDPIDNHKAVIVLSEEDFRRLVVHQFRLGRERMDLLQQHIKENTDLTRSNIEATSELVSIFKGAKIGASGFKWFGQRAREFVQFIYPFALLAGVIAAIWNGKWPKLGE